MKYKKTMNEVFFDLFIIIAYNVGMFFILNKDRSLLFVFLIVNTIITASFILNYKLYYDLRIEDLIDEIRKE